MKKKILHYILPKKCPYCHAESIKCMQQKDFYKNFNSTESMYVCSGCNARVGCHKGTSMPLGRLADNELCEIKQKIHAIIDMKWSSFYERKVLYRVLGKKYGSPFHVGFLDNEKARFVLYDLGNGFEKELSGQIKEAMDKEKNGH